MAKQPGRPATAAALSATLLLCACAGTLRDQPPPRELDRIAVESRDDYVIGALDLLQVSVWRQPELSANGVVVRTDGKISIPLLDDVIAAGLRPRELKEVLTERLSEFVTTPTVTVIVLDIRSKRVYVTGEVARQGVMALAPGMRVIDAISTAGGFTTFAGKDRVKLIRTQNGAGPLEFRFDFDEFVDGKNLEQNVLLLPGDHIVVPEQAPFWR